MKIKPVVKVMNFHSLLRVEKTKKEAQKYLQVEEEIKLMIDVIMNNRNIKLSKLLLKSNPMKPKLNIYLGSDFGFCSFFNSRISELILADDTDKIIIGKKLTNNAKNVVLRMPTEELYERHAEIENLIYQGITEEKYSEVHIIYNKYKNTTEIDLVDNRLFPLDKVENASYIDDFVYEGDIQNILTNLVSLYIMYELTLCNISSYASENILRQDSTSKSLKKIDELEEVEYQQERKAKKAKEFKKVIEVYTRLKNFTG